MNLSRLLNKKEQHLKPKRRMHLGSAILRKRLRGVDLSYMCDEDLGVPLE